jgi:hypothetical protein
VPPIRPWIFEFFHAPGNPAQDAAPEMTAAHFATYLDLWQGAEALGLKASSSASIISGRATALRRIC